MRPKRLYLTDIADAANAIGRFFGSSLFGVGNGQYGAYHFQGVVGQ